MVFHCFSSFSIVFHCFSWSYQFFIVSDDPDDPGGHDGPYGPGSPDVPSGGSLVRGPKYQGSLGQVFYQLNKNTEHQYIIDELAYSVYSGYNAGISKNLLRSGKNY